MYKSKSPKKKITHSDMAKKTGKGELTNEEIAKLSKHKFNHTAKHISEMKKLMKEGMSFTKAHNKVMKDFGK